MDTIAFPYAQPSPDARDSTKFITLWDRDGYLRTPQGFHPSGDAYTRRFGIEDSIFGDENRNCILTCIHARDDISFSNFLVDPSEALRKITKVIIRLDLMIAKKDVLLLT